MKRLAALLAIPLAACQPAPAPAPVAAHMDARAQEFPAGRFQPIGKRETDLFTEIYFLDTRSGVVCSVVSAHDKPELYAPNCSQAP